MMAVCSSEVQSSSEERAPNPADERVISPPPAIPLAGGEADKVTGSTTPIVPPSLHAEAVAALTAVFRLGGIRAGRVLPPVFALPVALPPISAMAFGTAASDIAYAVGEPLEGVAAANSVAALAGCAAAAGHVMVTLVTLEGTEIAVELTPRGYHLLVCAMCVCGTGVRTRARRPLTGSAGPRSFFRAGCIRLYGYMKIHMQEMPSPLIAENTRVRLAFNRHHCPPAPLPSGPFLFCYDPHR